MTTPTEKLLDALARHGCPAHKIGSGWSARCPAHDDQQPSLSIGEGDDGLALLNCHAGCQATAIVEALGLRMADLMPADDRAGRRPDGSRKGRQRPQGRDTAARAAEVYSTAEAAVDALQRKLGPPSAQWPYHDAGGDGVGLVLRWDIPDGKTIRPVARTPEGWVCRGMPEPRPLYRLPDLAKAERVYVVEGEKCAEAARSIGLVATTSAHGAQAAGKADWSPLAGKDVAIFPDHDDAGRKYASDVASILGRLDPPSKVRIVELPGLQPGGDLADWLDARDAAEPEALRAEIERLVESAAVVEVVEPEPASPAPLTWRPFPVEALPEPVREFVVAGSQALGCDPTLIALPMLAALASGIGAFRRIRIKPGWSEPAVVWSAIVSPSGTLKSPAIDLVLGPIKERQAELIREFEEADREYQESLLTYDADLSDWKKRGRKAGDPPPRKPDPPACSRLYAADVTIEALADRLQENPRGLLVARDELGGWLGSFDTYKGGGRGSCDAPKWLEMHRAGEVVIDRKSTVKKLIHIPRAAVSLTGGIQPEPLRTALGRDHFENGLAARLLLAMPPRTPKKWREAVLASRVRWDLADVFERLWSLRPKSLDDDRWEPIDLGLSPEAQAAWVGFYNEFAERQNEAQGDLAAALSKLEGYCGRLALVFALVEWAASGPDAVEPEAVGLRAVDAAVRLTWWFAHEVERIYEWMHEGDEDRERRELLDWIGRRGGAATARELQQGPRRYRGDAEGAEAALEGLAKAGLGRWEASPSGTRGQPTRRLILCGDGYGNSAVPEENANTVAVATVASPESEVFEL